MAPIARAGMLAAVALFSSACGAPSAGHRAVGAPRAPARAKRIRPVADDALSGMPDDTLLRALCGTLGRNVDEVLEHLLADGLPGIVFTAGAGDRSRLKLEACAAKPVSSRRHCDEPHPVVDVAFFGVDTEKVVVAGLSMPASVTDRIAAHLAALAGAPLSEKRRDWPVAPPEPTRILVERSVAYADSSVTVATYESATWCVLACQAPDAGRPPASLPSGTDAP